MNSNTECTNMSSAIQEAILLNNKGTRLVRQCQYDAALQSFTTVIEMLKPLAAIAEEHKEKEDDEIGNADADTNADTESSVPLTISFTNKSMDTDTFDDSNDINDSKTTTTPSSRTSSSSSSSLDTDLASTLKFGQHFVFRDPVIIPTASIPFASSASLSKFLMIVMYNVALTFHLHALSFASSSSPTAAVVSSKKKKRKAKKYFAQSKEVYELALKMHLELDDDIDPLFTLALTNNLGLIYRTTKRKDKSTICFQNMFSTMMYLLDTNAYHEQDASTSSNIQECIWDGLLSNAMNILFKHMYEVAAAAA